LGEISNLFVVGMGIGTVFVGLILIIFFCLIIGLFCKIGSKKESVASADTKTDLHEERLENRQEIIAAVTAACAEDMGKDVSALRVVSFKKL